jgi:hypothetical protein
VPTVTAENIIATSTRQQNLDSMGTSVATDKQGIQRSRIRLRLIQHPNHLINPAQIILFDLDLAQFTSEHCSSLARIREILDKPVRGTVSSRAPNRIARQRLPRVKPTRSRNNGGRIKPTGKKTAYRNVRHHLSTHRIIQFPEKA